MHFSLLTDTRPRICSCGFFRNTYSHAKRASSTVILASADVASFLSASTNHCGCTGTDHRFRNFYVTNLTRNFQWFAMLRSSQTFHFRPNHQMVSLTSRTDALISELFLCPTSLIGLCLVGLQLPATSWVEVFYTHTYLLGCRLFH